ncbi:MAG: ParA family protein [Candidatus Omnitrophica bacterium]|nr:ParA family protein [Candidatus Omnitrophota bacterium]
MARIISVCNQKGGTGKTTTSVNLSHALSQSGKRVLIVDTDPQGNSTSGVGVNKNVIEKSVYDVLLNKHTVAEARMLSVYPNLDIIPCNINLTGAEIELVGALSRETRLRKALSAVREEYDFIFIDSPPSLGLLTLNALVASDSIIIPIQCEFYALEGVSQLLQTINLIKDGLNPALEIEGVLMTMADFRTNLTSEVIKEIKNYFNDKVYESIIPRNVKLSEAPSYGKPIVVYDGASIGAKKYMELADEVLRAESIRSGDKSLQHNNLSSVEKRIDFEKFEKVHGEFEKPKAEDI